MNAPPWLDIRCIRDGAADDVNMRDLIDALYVNIYSELHPVPPHGVDFWKCDMGVRAIHFHELRFENACDIFNTFVRLRWYIREGEEIRKLGEIASRKSAPKHVHCTEGEKGRARECTENVVDISTTYVLKMCAEVDPCTTWW